MRAPGVADGDRALAEVLNEQTSMSGGLQVRQEPVSGGEPPDKPGTFPMLRPPAESIPGEGTSSDLIGANA